MLRQLSLRNAKRQAKEYSLYFITLVCTVSFMYAFNTLLFSDIIKTFSSAEVLPYMIVAASLLIVLVMGWIVGYMTAGRLFAGRPAAGRLCLHAGAFAEMFAGPILPHAAPCGSGLF